MWLCCEVFWWTMCILASTSREEVFQTICSLVMFFERQMVMELFSKSRHCNYWASHSGLLLDGSMWFHVQRWSKLSQTYSVTNTQFSQPMSGIVKDFSCSSWSWWWTTFSLPAFTTPPRRRRSGHFYCVLTTPSVCPGHNQVLLLKSAPSKTICRASKQAYSYSCCKSSKLFS